MWQSVVVQIHVIYSNATYHGDIIARSHWRLKYKIYLLVELYKPHAI